MLGTAGPRWGVARSRSVNRSVRELWTPLVGAAWASRIATDVNRFVIGYGLSSLLFLAMIFPPLAWPGSGWAWMFGGTLGSAAVASGAVASRSLVHTSKETGRRFRAAGIAINHDPGIQSVAVYGRWLRSNNLTVEQARKAVARPMALRLDE